MHFTHYQKAGDKVFAANPFESNSKVSDYLKFETWLSTQPPIYADPSIEDGGYKVDELEISWQYESPYSKLWFDEVDEDTLRDSLNRGLNVRQYATLKQPVKQEEKLVKTKGTYTTNPIWDMIEATPENATFKLKEWRRQRGFTLRQVEEKTGISNAYLSQVETGKVKNPSFDVMVKLCRLYFVKMNILY